MSIFDKYAILKAQGVKALPFQAHAGMAFFFTTLLAPWWVAVVPAMLVVITGKEYLDARSAKQPFSYFDLGSWAAGAALAILLIIIRGQ